MTDLIKLANVNLNHFPRHEKYGLSQQIRNTMYDVYNLIIEGEKRYHKKTSLTELDVKHQQLRMMLKLAYELDYFKYHNGKTDRSQTETDRRYLKKLKRGANFVGYRTWKSVRFIRKRSLYNFSKALKAMEINSLISIVGNAKRTATYAYFMLKLKTKGVQL